MYKGTLPARPKWKSQPEVMRGATQSGPGATVGLIISILILLFFGAANLWLIRSLDWPLNSLR